MSKINVMQRLSGNKRLDVGPNDMRRRLGQKKINKPVHKFDARDHLNKKSKIVDARDKLKKIQHGSNGKVQPKNIKKLMSISMNSDAKSSLKNGSLTRTVKGNSSSKVRTNLKGGTLTRTVKGMDKIEMQQRKPVSRSRPPLLTSGPINKATAEKVKVQSQTSRKRKPVALKNVWTRAPEPRRPLPVQSVAPVYDQYSTVVQRQTRPRQSRPNLESVQVSRPYEESVLTSDYSRPTTIIDRSYSPDYDLIREDASRQFRQFLQQQEMERHALLLREEMLSLEARRRSSALDLQEYKNRYYEDEVLIPRKPPVSSFSFGHEVIVSNLIPVIHESEIESCFLQFGNVLAIDFVNKTTAKIKYENQEDAKMAALNLDNKEVPVIFGTAYIGTRYSKQRISVKLPSSSLLSSSSRSYPSGIKPANRSYVQVEKNDSFRDVATFIRPRSIVSRPAASRPYSYRSVQHDLDLNHSGGFSNRSDELSPPPKSFLVRRM